MTRSGSRTSFAGPPLEAGRPHVWVVDVTDEAFLALGDHGGPGEPLWSATDRARASRLTDEAASRRLRARRAAVRIILAAYQRSEPGAIRIVTAPGGKPVAVPHDDSPTPPAFSVGHSGTLFCVAVAPRGSIGCDVERLRAVPRAPAIAERWFGPDEARDVVARGEDVDAVFMELWTCKEALAKRHGAGLRLMMGQATEPSVRRELDVTAERQADRLRVFEPAAGYAGAIACSDPIADVEIVRPGGAAWTT